MPKSKFHIRLSGTHRLLILAGLDWIASNYNLRAQGRASGGRSFGEIWNGDFDPGIYNQKLMDDLLALRARASSLTSYGRLRFATSLQVSACALAVRIALKRHRHGHHLLKIPRIDSASTQILGRLEVVRKRVKRAELRQYGRDGYRQRLHDWQRFIVWLRAHVANCGCIPERRLKRKRKLGYRALVDRLVNWTRQELVDRKVPVPDELELRRLVRLALHYVRRGRKSYDERHLFNDKVFASGQLATFVSIRMEKASNKRGS